MMTLGPLSGKAAWAAYGAAWLAFAAGHAAVDVFSDAFSLVAALQRTAVVIFPAALLGVAAIEIANRIAIRLKTVPLIIAAHIASAFVYAASWIALTWGANLARANLAAANFIFFTPPPAAIHWHLVAGVMIYVALAAIAHAARAYDLQRKDREKAALEIALSSFNPHFLFNTLHSLRALMRLDPDKAEDAHEKLARVLRRAVNIRQAEIDLVCLNEEFDFCKDYIALERMRFGEKLNVVFHVDEPAKHALLPPFIVQPLLENAVKHGVSQQSSNATVRVSAIARDGTIVINVENPYSEAEPPEDWVEGYGLSFVRQRLHATYGDAARVEFRNENGLFRATLSFPLTVDADE